MKVDVQEDGSAWRRCLRVRVECDLRIPISQGSTIVVDGRKNWVPYQYEKLSRLCFNCGRVLSRVGRSKQMLGVRKGGINRDKTLQIWRMMGGSTDKTLLRRKWR